MFDHALTIRYPYRWLLPVLVFLLLCGSGAAAAGTDSDKSFLSPDKAFSYTVSSNRAGNVVLRWEVADGYYLYRSRLNIRGADGTIGTVNKPEGKLIHDPYFGDEYIYRHQTTVTVDPGDATRLKLTWQGCAEAGLCYPPQHATVDVPAPKDVDEGPEAADGRSPQSTAAVNASLSGPANSDRAFAERLAGGSFGWTLLIFFGAGVLLTFTPCVLPMVPILSGVIVGAGARGLRGAMLSLAFVIPMATTYALFGVAATLAGANLQAALQTPVALGAVAAVFVALALSMFGVFDLQLPAPVRERLGRASASRRGGHAMGAAAMGVISALLVSPCMTAPLAGALLYIAQSGNATLGGSALLALGLGMGVPLLVVGTLGAQFMPRPGPWMKTVKVVFGFVLLATALWMIERVLPAPAILALRGALAIAAGTALGLTALRAAGVHTVRVAAITGSLLLALWGILLVIGAAGGATDPWRPLVLAEDTATTTPDTASLNDRFRTVTDPAALDASLAEARKRDRWVVVDFYADWCVSCQIIDRTVFGNARVADALAKATLIRPDVTDDNPGTRRLMQDLNVVGPPTILFIAPNGQEQRSARIVGELDADAFLDHWQGAHDTAGDAP